MMKANVIRTSVNKYTCIKFVFKCTYLYIYILLQLYNDIYFSYF